MTKLTTAKNGLIAAIIRAFTETDDEYMKRTIREYMSRPDYKPCGTYEG